MATTDIEWTDRVWNPARGCALVSEGCRNCYAMKQAHRFSGTGKSYDGLTVLGNHGPRWTGRARFVPEKLSEPLRWTKPARVFVNSMSDLFHEDLTNEQIAAVFGVMAACPQHTFQILTKRPSRMVEWFRWLDPAHALGVGPSCALDKIACHADDALEMLMPRAARAYAFAPGRGATVWPLPNLWLGVSVEDQPTADERIPLLLQAPAAVRWVSAEPLLGPVDLERIQWPRKHRVDVLRGGAWDFGGFPGFTQHSDMRSELVNWVVVGGESGPGARPFDIAWARSIVAQCRDAGTPVFVKQLGSNPRGWCAMNATEVSGAPEPENHFCNAGEAHEGYCDGACRMLADRKGGDPSEWPDDLRVRRFPEPRR